jgi:hypothetical protein
MFCGSTATAHLLAVTTPPNQSFSEMQLTIEMLSAAHGVDFKDYLGRLDVSVKRNWFASMPESALMEKRGIVTLALHIQSDGTLPADDPKFESVAGIEEFNKAAADAIRNAIPFERLPEGLTPQNIKLKIIFYYNLPTDSKKRTTRQSKTQNAMQVTTSDQHLPVLGPALQKTSAAKPKELSPRRFIQSQ